MSIIHLNRTKNQINTLFGNKIDLSGIMDANQENYFLTRAQHVAHGPVRDVVAEVASAPAIRSYPNPSLAVLGTCILTAVLALTPAYLFGQEASSKRILFVTVTDPVNRFVTGLEQEHFEIVENGVKRPITYFVNVDSPISIAIASDAPSQAVHKLNGPEDELIQTQSLPNALRALAASRNPRKVLIQTIAADAQAIPGGIQVLRVNPTPTDIAKAVVEVYNQYVVGFAASDPSSKVDVAVKQPIAMPRLKPVWK